LKKFLLMLFIAFSLSEAYGINVKTSDEDQLKSLVDSFSIAIVKKDKVWMSAKLSETCKMYEPSGSTLDKSGIIYTFTGGIYDVSKSSALNKSFTIEAAYATGLADFDVMGVANLNGNRMDIAGSYRFNLKFVKSDKGWTISEITINQG
jgi:hypothetical protein